MAPHILRSEIYIDKPIDEVFAFFSKAENLELLSPSSIKFQILTPLPIEMQRGRLIDYRIQLLGIPFSWKTEIADWNPPHRFVDVQLSGPYKLWEHTHEFKAKEGGTLMTDTVRYLSPGGLLEFIPHHLFVKRQVRKIFASREKSLKRIFSER